MNFKYFCLFIVVVSIAACKNTGNSLVGKWEIAEFTVVRVNTKTIVETENELRQKGSIWTMNLKRNGDFRQDFNMRSRDKKMETETGTWESDENTLTIHLDLDGKSHPMTYIYKFENDILILTLKSKQNTGEVISKFKRVK